MLPLTVGLWDILCPMPGQNRKKADGMWLGCKVVLNLLTIS
jgi:hypothetical protein